MKRILWIVFISVFALILAACSNETKNNRDDDGVPEMLEVELTVQETAEIDEKIVLKAFVTQGEEKIIDADQVDFEIWEEGKKADGKMIEAKNKKDGTYTTEVSFDHDGLYTVQVHVTARGQHTMPKKLVTVGEGAPEEERDHDGHEHEHSDGFSMHFLKPNVVEKGKETALIVHLQYEDHPLEKVNVRYEIWNYDVSDKHEWLDAEEGAPGEYSSSFTFSEAAHTLCKFM